MTQAENYRRQIEVIDSTIEKLTAALEANKAQILESTPNSYHRQELREAATRTGNNLANLKTQRRQIESLYNVAARKEAQEARTAAGAPEPATLRQLIESTNAETAARLQQIADHASEQWQQLREIRYKTAQLNDAIGELWKAENTRNPNEDHTAALFSISGAAYQLYDVISAEMRELEELESRNRQAADRFNRYAKAEEAQTADRPRMVWRDLK